MKSIQTLLILAVSALLFSGCETTQRAYNPSWGYGDSYETQELSNISNRISNSRSYTTAGVYNVSTKDDPDFEGDKTTNIPVGSDSTASKRKITYTANVNLQVANTDSIADYVTKIAENYGGYMSASTGNSITIKVKADSIKPAIAKIEALGEVKYSTISSQDVTDQYMDLNIRLENAMKSRQRYLELLEKAQNVEEALMVEKELERLNLTIDQIKGTLNQLTDRIQYSTITVVYYKKQDDNKPKPGILGYVFVGLYKGVKWLFVRG